MRAILAIALKDLSQLFRDKVGFFFVFIFPLMIGILFGFIFSGGSGGGGGGGGPSGVRVLVVDTDQSQASRAFLDALSSEGTLEVTPEASADTAVDLVRKGRYSAAVILPSGFQASLRRVFEGGGAPIEVAIDPARQFERGIIEGLVTAAGFRTLVTVFTEPDQAIAMIDESRRAIREATDIPPLRRGLLESLLGSVENLARDQAQAEAGSTPGDAQVASPVGANFAPIRVEVRSVARDKAKERPSFEITFPQASAWGIMAVVMGFGISIVTERSSGTLTRLLMAPITKWHVIGGKALGCFIGSLLVQILLFAVGIIFFGISPHSWPLLVLAVVCGCIGFVGVMMTLAVIGRTATASEGISRATLIVLALVGGAGVPLFVMPPLMRTLAGISPFKWLILALEGALWREWGISERILPCAILLGVGALGFVIGALLFREEV